jgi:hypothetical protein
MLITFRSTGVQKFRSSGVAEFRSGSPVGLYCARIGDKQLGDLFEEMFHLCSGAITQIDGLFATPPNP